MSIFWELMKLKQEYKQMGMCYCTVEKQIAEESKSYPDKCIFCLSEFDDYDPDFAIKNRRDAVVND